MEFTYTVPFSVSLITCIRILMTIVLVVNMQKRYKQAQIRIHKISWDDMSLLYCNFYITYFIERDKYYLCPTKSRLCGLKSARVPRSGDSR